MQYARLIINPAAGAGKTLKQWPRIHELLRGIGLHFEYDFTEAPKHAIELAREAVKRSYDLIVSVGGDGTIYEVVNGLHDSNGAGDVSLGIISTGTGNDFIRSIGLSPRYSDGCRRLLDPRRLLIDLGLVEYSVDGRRENRLFVNFAGIGFDAEVVRATTQRFKALGGFPSYLLGLLTTFLGYRNQSVSLTIDGQTETRKLCTAVVANGRYGGGSMLLAPNADLTDGFFDLVTVGDVSKPDLLWSLPRIYRGTHLSHPKVNAIRAAEVTVDSATGAAVQADGELLGLTPARFSILPSALNILV